MVAAAIGRLSMPQDASLDQVVRLSEAQLLVGLRSDPLCPRARHDMIRDFIVR
jgi:hypothetical protein